MLRVESACKAFGATVALDEVSFEAAPGRPLAIVGENGSGKSTLMRAIAGEMKLDRGRIWWKDREVKGPSLAIHLVHQELALCPHLSGAENIFLGLEEGFILSRRGQVARAQQLLEGLGFGHIDAGAPAGRLPVSHKQALEIARALARKAELVLFDEPTSSLTSEDKERFFSLLRRLEGQGVATLTISHFLEEVRAAAQEVLILRDGRRVHLGPLGEIRDSEIVEKMVGRSVEEAFPRSPHSPGEVLLSVQDVTASRGRVEGASLEVRKGEVVGLAGLTGAGRTELLRAIMKLDRGARGGVKVGVWSPRSPRGMWGRGVGFVSEERKEDGLALGLSIAENIDLPRQKGWLRKPRRQDEEAEGWIAALKIKCAGPAQPVGRLSGGNQQKAAFARLLRASCEVFLLDEPTRGIDVASKTEIYRLVDEAALRGCAILLASSYLPELLGVCDRILVMNRGKLAAEFSAEEATPEKLLAECVK